MGQGEPPQGVFLHRRPIFQIFRGCQITLKSLVLIVFYLPVNYLFLPLLDCIKKAYRTNLQTEKTTLTQKPSNIKTSLTLYQFIFLFMACAIIIITLCLFAKRRNIAKNYVYFANDLVFFRNFCYNRDNKKKTKSRETYSLF